jgi:hypothetical protein
MGAAGRGMLPAREIQMRIHRLANELPGIMESYSYRNNSLE